MLLFLDDPACHELQDHGQLPENLEIIPWHRHCIDLFNKNGGEATSIREICQHLDIPLTHTMAFGNGLNDIDMFRTVVNGIAMGDAREELKAIAAHVTDTAENHGIANALKHHRLIV